MKDKMKKSEGPSCACGRVDIYKETLKNKKEEEKTKEDEGDSIASQETEKTKKQ